MAICKNCGRPLILNGGKCSYCGASPNGQVPTSKSNTEPASIKLPPVRTFTINGVSFNMILVEGGTFWMGEQNVDPRRPNYDPEANGDSVRRVTVDTFYIGETVVTRELLYAIYHDKCKKEGKAPWYRNNLSFGGGKYISESDIEHAADNIKLLSSECMAQTGEFFKIPTVEEWEFAARGGNKSKGYRFSGGNILDDVGWYRGYVKEYSEIGYPGCYDEYHVPYVMNKKPNELGIYDMSGLVYELCLSEGRAVFKGGSWVSLSPSECRIASFLDSFDSRLKGYMGRVEALLGCRLALIPKYERIGQ